MQAVPKNFKLNFLSDLVSLWQEELTTEDTKSPGFEY